MELGVQVSSLKPVLTTSEEVAAACSEIAAMGVTSVQLQWIDPSVPIADIVHAMQKQGLTSVSVQDFYQKYIEDPQYYQSLMRESKSHWLCLSRIPKEWQSLQGLEAYALSLRKIAEELANEGMCLCFHPTAPDYQMDQNVCLLDRLMELVPEMELCLDLYHVNKAGRSITETIRRYSGRICMVHFKEGKKLEDGSEILVPTGQGDICWDGVMEACESAGVPYGLVEQETWNRDPYDCLREALEYCREKQQKLKS